MVARPLREGPDTARPDFHSGSEAMYSRPRLPHERREADKKVVFSLLGLASGGRETAHRDQLCITIIDHPRTRKSGVGLKLAVTNSM